MLGLNTVPLLFLRARSGFKMKMWLTPQIPGTSPWKEKPKRYIHLTSPITHTHTYIRTLTLTPAFMASHYTHPHSHTHIHPPLTLALL